MAHSNSYYLVTGAAGSIGKLFVDAILKLNSTTVVIGFDNDDTDLYELDEIYKSTHRFIPFLGDITNKDCLSNLFNQFSFTLVVHAAAHKQVSLLERFPDRAFEVNTAASIRLLEFAKQQDSHFLFISSDKSVEPSGILGISKWLVEAFIIQTQSAKTSIFRLPNIKGSRGSFFSEWEKVLHQKGFIPITDEQSTRFVISIYELQNCISFWLNGFKENSSCLVTPSNVEEIHLLNFIKSEIESKHINFDKIKIVGLRDGEKVSEKLYWDDENRPNHETNCIFTQDLSNLESLSWVALKNFPARNPLTQQIMLLKAIFDESCELLKHSITYE